MNPFWSNIFRSSGYEDSLAYFLGTIPIFDALKKKDLRLLESMVHVRNYQPDETVFHEGDIGSGMYCIRSGQVLIYLLDENGREIEQALLGPGDFFGEVALTAQKPRIATARTLETTVLIGLFRADILEAVNKYPATTSKILLGLTRCISDRLQYASLKLQHQGKSSYHTEKDQ
ncbi:MAG TPA: cyclic nucleotide-binding domain-containing protein [Geopsychrobacteraceae bacterium]|nr:cyclic nucleotide-binding domain-containing protein [Geopsychrobacteraceae bacterium]